jgi:hypothetical protein
MTDKPKDEKKIVTIAKKVWNFLDGHKTKIGTAIYFANELFGAKLPTQWSGALETGAEIMIALGWVHYLYKGKNNINKLKKK